MLEGCSEWPSSAPLAETQLQLQLAAAERCSHLLLSPDVGYSGCWNKLLRTVSIVTELGARGQDLTY